MRRARVQASNCAILVIKTKCYATHMSYVVTRRRKGKMVTTEPLAAWRVERARERSYLDTLDKAELADCMQELINEVAFELRYANAEVGRLKPGLSEKPFDPVTTKMAHELWVSVDVNGNRIVDFSLWIKRVDSLQDKLFKMVEVAQKLGLTDRLTKAKEAEVALLGEALAAACRRIGMEEDVQRELGSALRKELAVIEGKAK